MTNDQARWAERRRIEKEFKAERQALKAAQLPAAREKVAMLIEALRDAHGDKENETEQHVWKAVIQQAKNVR